MTTPCFNHKIFQIKPLKQPSLFQRMLGKYPNENAIIEINNLLATQFILNVQISDIQIIANTYKINIKKAFKHELKNFYSSYLRGCLLGKFVSEDELIDLKHLKYISGLNDQEVCYINHEVVHSVYDQELKSVLKSNKITSNEKRFINELQSNVVLPLSILQEVKKESVNNLVEKFLKNSLSENKLAAQEINTLKAIAFNLGTSLKATEHNAQTFGKYKLYWKLDNDEMPNLSVNFTLLKGEKCYFQTQSEWCEEKLLPNLKDFSFDSLLMKISEGKFWRKQRLPKFEKVFESSNTATGNLYVSNKRIIFRALKTETIELHKIQDFNTYNNGLHILEKSGKTTFLKFYKNVQIFAMMLGKSLSNL